MTHESTTREIALVADEALVLRVDPSVHAAIAPWIPRHRAARSSEATARATLSVEPHGGERPSARPSTEPAPPTLVLGGASAYVDEDDMRILGTAGLTGRASLAMRCATVAIDASSTPLHEIQGALTLASALLLGRIGRALVHAAAVVDRQGRGWLLVGDSHSGKTTTCATLTAAGWRYVADDQVVIDDSVDGVMAEGWPRDAHLDRGWREGRVTRVRAAVDLADIRASAWQNRVRVHGAWFTSVDAEQPTATRRISPADALGRLIRQSPWLLADAATAAASLALLGRVAMLPCAALSLGRDSYANGERLADCLDAAIGAG